jgi:hypothetical protein
MRFGYLKALTMIYIYTHTQCSRKVWEVDINMLEITESITRVAE